MLPFMRYILLKCTKLNTNKWIVNRKINSKGNRPVSNGWRSRSLRVKMRAWLDSTFQLSQDRFLLWCFKWVGTTLGFYFNKWRFHVIRILVALEKQAAFLSSNIWFHIVFRARTRVVLKKFPNKDSSSCSWYTHLLMSIQERSISSVPSSLRMFADLPVLRRSYFKPSLLFLPLFSHTFVHNPLPIILGSPLHFSSQLHLLAPLITISGRTVHYGHTVTGLRCHQDTLMGGEKLKDGFLLP